MCQLVFFVFSPDFLMFILVWDENFKDGRQNLWCHGAMNTIAQSWHSNVGIIIQECEVIIPNPSNVYGKQHDKQIQIHLLFF